MDLQLLIVSAGFINALILFIALASLKGKIKIASRFLGLFIFSYFVTLANWVIIPPIASQLNILLPWAPLIFFIAPLGYYFFLAIDNPTFKIRNWHLGLLIPGILDTFYHLVHYFYTLIASGSQYTFLMNRGPAYFIHDGIAIIYSLVCYVLILKFVFKVQQVEAPARNFYRFFVLFIGYMVARWATFYLVDLLNPRILNNELFLGAWVLEMIGLLIIGYKGLIDSSLFNIRQKQQSGIDESEIKQKSDQLLTLLKEKKLYLKNDLSRKILAEELGTSEVSISHILNKGLETGFYPLLNKYRTKEVIVMFKAGEHKKFTLETLAKQAGFGSLTTFNKAFKTETGQTPKNYIEEKGL